MEVQHNDDASLLGDIRQQIGLEDSVNFQQGGGRGGWVKERDFQGTDCHL